MQAKYKISDENLKLREYGRNVQMMVAYAKGLTDDGERNVLCHEIVRIMGNINPAIKEAQDHQQKLWDHFYHLTDYNIDIESDFDIPEKGALFTRPPDKMPYNNRRSRFRQYGHNIELMAEQAVAMNDEDRKLALVTMILNIMKMHLKGLEKDSNAEIIVTDHLRTISKGGLDYQPGDIKFHKFNAHAISHQHQQQTHQQQNAHRGKKNRNHGGGNKKNYKRRR